MSVSDEFDTYRLHVYLKLLQLILSPSLFSLQFQDFSLKCTLPRDRLLFYFDDLGTRNMKK